MANLYKETVLSILTKGKEHVEQNWEPGRESIYRALFFGRDNTPFSHSLHLDEAMFALRQAAFDCVLFLVASYAEASTKEEIINLFQRAIDLFIQHMEKEEADGDSQ